MPPTEPPNRGPKKPPFALTAARVGFWAPFVAIGLNLVLLSTPHDKGKPAEPDVTGGVVTIVLATCGFVFSILGLWRFRSAGTKKVFLYGIIGLLLNGCVLVSFVAGMVGAVEAARRRAVAKTVSKNPEKAGRDAVANYPGWVGAAANDSSVAVFIASMHDDSPAARDFSSLFPDRPSLATCTVQNGSGKAVTIDLRNVRIRLADGSTLDALPLMATLRTSREDPARAASAFGGPKTVPPGKTFTQGFIFLAHGFDWKPVHSVAVGLDGQTFNVPGSFLDVAEKQERIRGATASPTSAP